MNLSESIVTTMLVVEHMVLLHKVDSVVPLIVTGTDDKPTFNRLVDMKEWIIRLVGGS